MHAVHVVAVVHIVIGSTQLHHRDRRHHRVLVHTRWETKVGGVCELKQGNIFNNSFQYGGITSTAGSGLQQTVIQGAQQHFDPIGLVFFRTFLQRHDDNVRSGQGTGRVGGPQQRHVIRFVVFVGFGFSNVPRGHENFQLVQKVKIS